VYREVFYCNWFIGLTSTIGLPVFTALEICYFLTIWRTSIYGCERHSFCANTGWPTKL